jgi:uncharacterized protein (TIRG00374 family)
MSASLRNRILRLSCWALGVYAIVSVFRSTGAEPVRIALSALSGQGWWMLLIYAAVNFWDAWGWRVAFTDTAGGRLRFWELYLIRLAGEAVNGVTPFVDVGGEFLKVALTAKCSGLDKKPVLAAVVIQRIALMSSEVMFWLLGLAAALIIVPEVRQAKTAWIIAASVCVPVVAGLLWIIRHGFFSSIYGLVKKWVKTDAQEAGELESKIQDVDKRVSGFYTKERGRNVATLALHLIGWIAGGVETWVMFRMCGIDMPVWEGIMIEALFQLLKTASFFIPGNLGAQEAGMAYFGAWFGYAGPVGVAVSLLKRFRQLLWMFAGFGIWSWMAHRTHSVELYPTHHSKRPKI